MRRCSITIGSALLLLVVGCDGEPPTDGGPEPDAGPGHDAGPGNDSGPDPRPVVGVTFEEIDVDGDAFTDIHWIAGRPDEVLIASYTGEIFHYRVDGTSTTRLGTITVPEVRLMGDCGLLAIALDPEWATNGLLYAGHCIEEDHATRVTRLTWDGSDYDVADTAAVVLEVHETRGPYPWNHNVSNISFEPDGTMLVGVGDKSAATAVGQDPSSLPATVMRIVPNREADGSGYTAAPDNPFVAGGGAPEVFAYGLRYPWKIVRDPRGWYYVGDVGEGGFEEVNLLRVPGTNFGWNECSGPCSPAQAGLVDPLLWWPHNDDHPYVSEDPETLPGPRRAVWVAPGPPSSHPFGDFLSEGFLFGDTCTGWVRAASIDDDAELTADRSLGNVPYVTGWTWSPDGIGYVTTFGSCDVLTPIDEARLFRMVPRRE